MNLSRCGKGHFFDKEKYAICPYCAQNGQQGDGLTDVLTDVFTEGPMTTEAATEPLTDMSVTDTLSNTGRGGEYVPSPAIMPVDKSINNQGNSMQAGGAEEDDTNTVAFYDDIFITPNKTVQPDIMQIPPFQTVQTAQPVVISNVTTPCVGWLVVIKGMHLGQDFHLKTGKNFIGRDAKMDIVLDGDKSVSRNKHAILVYEPKQHLYLVQPGESSELVYLNDDVVLSPLPLKAYDVITVGEVNLLFMPLCGSEFNWTDALGKKV